MTKRHHLATLLGGFTVVLLLLLPKTTPLAAVPISTPLSPGAIASDGLIYLPFIANQYRPPTHISIDGDPADWAGYHVLITDPQGDSFGGGFDIAGVSALLNDRFLYVLIGTYGPRQDYAQLDLDIVTDNRSFVVSIKPDECWTGHLEETTGGQWKDVGEVAGAYIAGRQVVEYKILSSTFGAFTDLQLGVRPMGGECCGDGWYAIDDIGLVHVPRVSEAEPEPTVTYNACGAPVIKQDFDLTRIRGDEPHDIVISPDGKRAYALSRGTHYIFVIDVATNQIVAAIDLFTTARSPFGPGPDALALTPDGHLLLVANQTDNSVTLVDTTTNSIIKALPAPAFPMDVAVSPDGSVAYVVGHGEDLVAVIDLASRSVLTTIALPGNQVHPYAVAFTPDGSRAYVGTEGEALYRIDPTTYQVVATIIKPATGWSNGSVVITPDGRTAYLSSCDGNWVTKFDLVAEQLTQVFDIAQPEGLALSPDGSRLLVGRAGFSGLSDQDQRVVEIDPVSGEILGGVDIVSPAPHVSWQNDIQGMAFTPDGSSLYVAVVDADGIYVVETARLKVTGFIPLTAFARYRPTRAVISPDGATLYVADNYPQPAAISVIHLANGAVETIRDDYPLACAHQTQGLALSPDGTRLYAATDGHCILVIDTDQRKIIGSFSTGGTGNLSDLAIAPDGNKAYAVDWSGTLYSLDLVNRKTLSTVGTVNGAHYIKVSPDGQRAYITGWTGYAVVDLARNIVLHTQDFGGGSYFSAYNMRQVGVTPDSSQYIIGEFTVMHVFDTATFQELRLIDLFQWTPSMTLSTDVIFSPDGETAYLAMWDEKDILAFDTQNWQRTAVINVGRAPYFCVCPRYFALSPNGERLYAVCEQSDNVIAIDTTTNQVMDTISLWK
jgi:YVTN family beta-propeller protein